MKVLGIDPGYGILGWSIVEKNLKLIDFGAIETPQGLHISDRLCMIYARLNAIISEYNPNTAAIEKLFFHRNTTTALDVSRCLGVVILAIKQAGMDYAEYTPSQIKLALTGYGRANKAQIQNAMKMMFNISEIPKPDDAADALAVAACHCFSFSKGGRGS